MIEQQIQLEKAMTECSIQKFRSEFTKCKQNENLSNSQSVTVIMKNIIEDYTASIKQYTDDYIEGKPVKSTLAGGLIKLLPASVVALVSARIILNKIYSKAAIQSTYKAIGQALEDEWKMRSFKRENSYYYEKIQEDLNSRGAKADRKKYITMGVFNKRLDFQLDKWSMTEKVQAGLILINLFIETTGLVTLEDVFKKKKHTKILVATQELEDAITNLNNRLECMQPLFLPMVCRPKEWTSVLEGGYISPYIRKNKLIKNNDKKYLKKLNDIDMPLVYEALNHLQDTEWQINNKVLDVVIKLWEEGKAIGELPDRDDEQIEPYPYPNEEELNDYQKTVVQKWKRETYEKHKRNVTKRSNRILTSNILRIANQFKDYEKIWFPYQMDFRGRMYPIPVLLNPQGSDLSKALLMFAEGKAIDETGLKWLKIHGANVYGYDKVSYLDRVKWVNDHEEEILLYASNPIQNKEWSKADKPFQFLSWCMEYSDFLSNPSDFKSHIPIQLDGTCNGLQHYSALLKDTEGGKAVNLLNAEIPSDIYAKIAEKLIGKLEGIKNEQTNISSRNNNINDGSTNNDRMLAACWLGLGINRKLTKRPVMVLPYGGTRMSCTDYIQEYLTDNYSNQLIQEHFNISDNPKDTAFKASQWLGKYLWEAITETIRAATDAMDYLRKITRIRLKQKDFLEWTTPAGLVIRQCYKSQKTKTIRTELYGNMLYGNINIDALTIDKQRQVNGVCPNFIHSLDAACLMLYLHKCKKQGIKNFQTVHDCYGTYAQDTEMSAKLLREAFVEIYTQPILEQFTEQILDDVEVDESEIPAKPLEGDLDVKEVLHSDYFFN